jgi:hypothetical protein
VKQAGPPKLTQKFLKHLLPEESRQSVCGDLYKEFCDANVLMPGASLALVCASGSELHSAEIWFGARQ